MPGYQGTDVNSLQMQAKLYGKLICEQEGYYWANRGRRKMPDTFTICLPLLCCLPVNNDVISCHVSQSDFAKNSRGTSKARNRPDPVYMRTLS